MAPSPSVCFREIFFLPQPLCLLWPTCCPRCPVPSCQGSGWVLPRLTQWCTSFSCKYIFLSARSSLVFASAPWYLRLDIERALGNELKFTTTFHIAGRGSKCLPMVLLVFNLDRMEEDLMSLCKVCGQITSAWCIIQQLPLPPVPSTYHQASHCWLTIMIILALFSF